MHLQWKYKVPSQLLLSGNATVCASDKSQHIFHKTYPSRRQVKL